METFLEALDKSFTIKPMVWYSNCILSFNDFSNFSRYKEAASKQWVDGGGEHFCKNKMSETPNGSDAKCAVLPRSGRMFYIPGTCPQLLSKFSRDLWKKFQPKKWGFVRIFQTDFELHFLKISTFSTFPDIKYDWCIMRPRFFLLTQIARSGGPLRYLNPQTDVNFYHKYP